MRKRTIALLLMVATALATVAFLGLAWATTSDCTNTQTLTGSRFEIDTDANTKVDGPGTGCLDWDSVTATAKNDQPTGANDDSFGQGTAEDNPNPTIVDGSIPPNKSDLLRFGVYTESGGTTSGKFLELYWTRINNPSGTTNMDFELNKLFCDGTAANCANNGTAKNPVYVTPKRSVGDKLITYDLSKGGTVPTISIRTWNGSAWGSATVISGSTGQARGSVNQTAFTAAASTGIGTRDPFTFGEAAINYNALFSGNTCGTFGSAYLKSRSSDSFTAEIKDFVSPEKVTISNCSSISTTLSSTSISPGGTVHDSATLSGVTADAGGTVTYNVYTDSACTTLLQSAGTKTVTNGVVPDSDPVTFNNTGDFYWQAVYSGDANNAGSTSTCTDEHLVVSKQASTVSTAQKWVPNDTATVNHAGTVTFTLLKNVSKADCLTPPAGGYPAGSVIYGPDTKTLSGSGSTFTADSSNTTAVTSVASGDTYRWKVEVPETSTFKAVTTCEETTGFSSLDNGSQQTSS